MSTLPGELRNEIHFLRFIPDSLYFKLHFEEFYFPDEMLIAWCKELEMEWHCYLMTYRANYFNHEKNSFELCRVIHAAQLKETQVKKIKQIEDKFGRKIVLVAYRKPLVFNNSKF